MSKIILDLCGGTGCWSEPYKQAGYDVRVITLPYYDVLTYVPPNDVYGVLAAPPCTCFSIASSQYWNKYDENGSTEEALQVVKACLSIIDKCKPKFWALENPKGRLRKFIGNPVYSYYQYEFGGKFTKQTFLWGNFNTFLIKGPVNSNPIRFDEAKAADLYQLPDDYILNGSKMNKRSAQRSIYAPYFPGAFYEANK